MKMKKEDYAFLLKGAKRIGITTIKEHRVAIVKEGKAKDIDMRVRWDVFWAIKNKPDFRYLNDAHIDTALKSIMKELGYAAN